MRNNARKVKPLPFESDRRWKDPHRADDTHARIFHSMMVSPAWKDLTSNQKVLYLACKDRFFGEDSIYDSDGKKQELWFYMNADLWSNLYALYPRSSNERFKQDKKALMSHGFIEEISPGKTTRKKSIYAFSDEWKNWSESEEQKERRLAKSEQMKKNALSKRKASHLEKPDRISE